MKESSIFNARKSTSFQILYCVLERSIKNPEADEAWKKMIEWITSSQSYRDFDGISGEPMDFEWNIFPGFNTLQLSEEVKSLLYRLGKHQKISQEGIIFMSMVNDISCGTQDNEEECMLNAKFVSMYAKRFGKGQWSFLGLGSEKKWYCYH